MRRLLFLVLTTSLFFACRKTDEYPVVPEIEFLSYERFDSLVEDNLQPYIRFRLSFKDGDGDIGLKENETAPPYNVNFISSRYFKTDDHFELDTAGDKMDDYRIPYLTPNGRNKNIKGEIAVNYALANEIFNTAYFEMFIYDRALHKSNVVRTPEILIDTRR